MNSEKQGRKEEYSLILGKKDIDVRNKWYFIQSKIQNDKNLKIKHGHDPEQTLSNSKILKILVSICYDYFQDNKNKIYAKINQMRKELLFDQLNHVLNKIDHEHYIEHNKVMANSKS